MNQLKKKLGCDHQKGNLNLKLNVIIYTKSAFE